MDYNTNLREALEAMAKIRHVAADRFRDMGGLIQVEDSFMGEVRPQIMVYMPDGIGVNVGHEIRRAAGVTKITKKFKPYGGVDLQWDGETDHFRLCISFYKVCTLIGYKDKIIPAEPEQIIAAEPERIIESKPERIEKVPIWDCADMRSNAKKETTNA